MSNLVRKDNPDVRVLGTYERIEARAEIAHAYRNADGSIGYDHEGSSEVFWDTMETQHHPDNGKVLFLDEDGQTLTEDEVMLEEEVVDEETEPDED